MSDDSVLEGHVAAVFGPREILIDLGWQQGVQIGTRFVVLGPPVEIPLDGAGETVEIRLPKTIVKVVRFEGDSASVARTFRTVKGTPGFSASILGASNDRPEKFAYEDDELIDEGRDRVVRRGDLVRVTKGDEYLDDDI
ncbi:hypothetical protein [Nocardia sp. NPDC005366]|uniref:hypothetical protein n=1 Tax=Nocardia sp. NPDC005366 TaxID=3156878 RepID=UPI0033AFF293